MSATDTVFFCLRIQADDEVVAECALAEAFAAGAGGAEEDLEARSVTFAVYAPGEAVDRVREALAQAGVSLLSVSPVTTEDWSEAWKREARPIHVSPRLVVRPSFERVDAPPGACVLEVDPGQAFGTGAHESTRLALEGVDRWAERFAGAHTLLDVGTGTGVLALAALGLGCGRAVGFDLDPLAGQAAIENAERNGLASRLRVFVGGVEALSPAPRFDFVAANLLMTELLPILPALAACLAPGGRILFSGLLDTQAPEVETMAGSHGLVPEDRFERVDASGARWVALLMRAADAPPRP